MGCLDALAPSGQCTLYWEKKINKKPVRAPKKKVGITSDPNGITKLSSLMDIS